MADDAEIWRRLNETVARFFGDPSLRLGPETTAEEVAGWDSLANVELMVEIEEGFGIRFRTGEVAELAKVGDLVALISRRAAG